MKRILEEDCNVNLLKKKALWNSFIRFNGIEITVPSSNRFTPEDYSAERRISLIAKLKQRNHKMGLKYQKVETRRGKAPSKKFQKNEKWSFLVRDVHNMTVCLLVEHFADIYTEQVAKTIAEYTRRRSYVRGKKSEALHRYSPRLSERICGEAFYSRGVGDPVQRAESDTCTT